MESGREGFIALKSKLSNIVVLSPKPKVTPDIEGEKCGIFYNQNHPKVSISQAEELQKVSVSLDYHLSELRKMRHVIASVDLQTRDFDLALNILFGHQHVIWETLNRSYNQRAAAYAQSRKAGE